MVMDFFEPTSSGLTESLADCDVILVDRRRIEDATGLQKQTFNHMQETHEVSSKQVIRADWRIRLCTKA